MSERELILRLRNRHDVRLVARRPANGVLVEFMSGKGVPMMQYITVAVHELRAPSITIEHLKRLIGVLPMVAFVQDNRPAGVQAPAAPVEERWWNKD